MKFPDYSMQIMAFALSLPLWIIVVKEPNPCVAVVGIFFILIVNVGLGVYNLTIEEEIRRKK